MRKSLTTGSLFTGLGGFDLAFEQAGFETKWQVEINPDAQKILRRHWPNVPRWEDITTVDPDDLAPVDVVTFGSPCQDLSIAGKRAGLSGERSGLFHEAIRIIQGVRPEFAVWENVPGAFSSNGGRDFAAVLAAFRDCGAREFGWRVLDAQYFGVAQRRRRIFLVADFRGTRASEILFEREGVSGHPPTRTKAGKIAPTLSASGSGTDRPGGQGAEFDFYIPVAQEVDVRNLRDQGDQSGTLQAKSSGGYSLNYINPIVIQDARAEKQQNGLGIGEDAPMYTLDTTSQHAAAYLPEVAHTLRGEGFDGSEDGTGRGTPLVADSLTTKPWADNKGQESQLVTQNMAVRRLTPRETERLQGLPLILEWRLHEMTTDEMAAALLAAGWVTADLGTGKIFVHRGPGGRRLDEPAEAKGTLIKGYRSSKFHLDGETHPIRHHRLIWIAANGVPAEGMAVCHRNNDKLDNRLNNLYLATPEQNSHDARRDGLYPDYDHNPRAKIGIETARQIADDYIHSQGTIYQLADKYGISKSRVSQIVHEFGWTEVDANGKELSDSARYRLIGNAVAVPVVRWIANRIRPQLDD